jgi:peptidoglycan glycosyltransferase
VHLTIDSAVQQAAKDALGPRRGSVVAVDPRDGSVLALWSYPTYDPTFSSSNDAVIARAFRQNLAENPDKPTLARSYRERFFPGSTFKVVTAAAGLESGKVTDASPVYPSARGYQAPLTTRSISNFGGSSCGGALAEILAVSCNSAFAEMGAETLGPDPMIDTARRFGFGEKPPIDLPGAASSVFPDDFGKRLRAGNDPGDADVYENTPALAQAAIGQGNVSATPLQMALVAGAVANSGTIMRPHVLREIRDGTGAVDSAYTPAVWTTAMSPTNAATLRAAMVGVVTAGTADRLAIPGREVGGKTGTAQLGTNPAQSHAWIIGFAGDPGQNPTVAVAVIVEGQPGASEQTGGRVAAPIAKAVLEAALAGG